VDSTQEDVRILNAKAEAIADLREHVKGLLEYPEVLLMSELLERFGKMMALRGVSQLTNSTKKNFRRFLESSFGEQLQVIADDKGRLLVVPRSLGVQDLAAMIHNLKTEVATLKKLFP
jgi:hypothetical protein